MRRRRGGAIRRAVAALALLVAVSACTEPVPDGGPAAAEPREVDPSIVAQLRDYVKAGPRAEAAGDPVAIGYVNQEGGTPSFAEASFGADAAVDMLNTRLGGVNGRPLELVRCTVKAEEDGLLCAQKMLADDRITAVLTGALFTGNQPLLETLKGRKPVFLANPLTPADALHPDGFAFTPGAPGVVEGLTKFIATMLAPKPTKVSVVYAANPAGEAGFKLVVEPGLKAAGIAVKGVAVPDTAGPQEYGSAIQAAGAEDADVFMPLVTAPGCIGTYDALAALGVNTAVVTTGLCFGLPMQEHLRQIGVGGTAPEGWFFGAYGYTYFISTPLIDNYLVAAKAFARSRGLGSVDYTGFAGPTYSIVLLLARFMNEHGVGAMTADDFRAAARSFEGPVPGVSGPMKCGANPIYPSLCGTQMGVQQYLDQKWVSIADAYNGHPIIVNQPFVGSKPAASTAPAAPAAATTTTTAQP